MRVLVVAVSVGLLGCGDATTAANDAAPVDVAVADASDAPVVTTDVPEQPVDAGPPCPGALGTPAARAVAPTRGPMDDALRMNHLQAKGTHNSYHLRPAIIGPDWDYSQSPLDVQLESEGVRALELDIRWDTRCGRFRVFHLPILDPRSTCDLFTDCLGLVRRWSDAHPSHHPVFIQVEPKDAWDAPTTELRMTAMESEILSVFPRELVVTPDEVRGSSATLPEAIAARGWPTLGATRGRVLFFIDRTDSLRDVYTHGGRDLDGRLSFIDSAVGDPFAGVMVLNNPNGANVPAAVRAGYLVRVFSWTAGDAVLDPAVTAAGLASGAQIISTDFPVTARGGVEGVRIPGGTPSRCNPLTAPGGCTSAAIESLPR
jgi:hypothetical protein